MDRCSYAAFHAPLCARELNLFNEWQAGDPQACSRIAHELEAVVAVLERSAAMGSASIGREVAVQMMRLL